MERKDYRELADLAHWLKGAGGICGFPEFYQPAFQLEQAAQTIKPASCEQKLKEILELEQRIMVA